MGGECIQVKAARSFVLTKCCVDVWLFELRGKLWFAVLKSSVIVTHCLVWVQITNSVSEGILD